MRRDRLVDDIGSLAELRLYIGPGNNIADCFRKDFADGTVGRCDGTRYAAYLKLAHKESQRTLGTIQRR